ncbi:histone-lysine N-methyltransferase SETMAR isoform X1 [Lepus europaeus]|uniref:histone-lysine N-methyltransferase SETMAR isoform X1 n=1 Tax=Lepus europaeus TaxID=9983 RepID=UPI002B461921|nr:histone-lysine N-methyltransferase SETMAR isoform X1 [Lepus europaeus]
MFGEAAEAAALEDDRAAPAEPLDVARGLENLPVSAWPPEARPPPFKVPEPKDLDHLLLLSRAIAESWIGSGIAGTVPYWMPALQAAALPTTPQHLWKTQMMKILCVDFKYTPDHVEGPGADTDPAQAVFPGCTCTTAPCLPGTCSCLRWQENYDDHLRLRETGAEADYATPVFECNILCQCSDRCRNRVVQRGLQFHLQVFQTDLKGWGLRTLEFIPKGRFVCEYAGEILGSSEAQRRIHLQTIHDSNYILAVREHVAQGKVLATFVDPTHTGNVGRFLNHSCAPNLLMVPVRIDSMVPRLALFAAKDILPGEELCYDYSGRFLNHSDGEDKDRLDNGKLRKPCYCGAKSCTAFLPYDSSLYCPG